MFIDPHKRPGGAHGWRLTIVVNSDGDAHVPALKSLTALASNLVPRTGLEIKRGITPAPLT